MGYDIRMMAGLYECWLVTNDGMATFVVPSLKAKSGWYMVPVSDSVHRCCGVVRMGELNLFCDRRFLLTLYSC